MPISPKRSKEQIIAEIIKCGKDPIYFIKTYAYIQHAAKGLVPFLLYPYQEDIIRGYLEHRKNILLKARQLGMTTTTAAYIAWLILFHRDKNVLIVATKQETSKNMIRIIKNIFKYVPKWLIDIGKVNIDNRHSVELENGSRVKAVTTSADVGRSEAVSFLVVDEVAFIPTFEEIWTGLGPTISTGGSVALMSSPNGTGNMFHRLYEGARNNDNGFNCHFGTYINPRDPNEVYNDRFMWWVHPEHDDSWFAAETSDKSPREINQEFLCCFNASGDTFIFHEDISRIERQTREPKNKFHINRDVWIWEEPDKNGSYLISCDVSRGDAKDYSAFHVLRMDTCPLRQVAEYKGKIRPDQLGMLLVSVGQYYNNATIAPENNNGWSGQTIMKIQECNYPFLYFSRRRKSKEKETAPVDPYYAMTRNDFLPGYSVTSANRNMMLAKLEQYIRMGDVQIISPRLLDEIKTFIVTETNRAEAMRGYSDDLVMALAGGLWVRDEAFLFSYRNDEMSNAMLAGMSTSRTTTKQYQDFNYQGNSFDDRARIMEHVESQHKIVMADGNSEDISWLIKG